jgi:hypothetical protein
MLTLCVDLFGCQNNDPGCSCTMRVLHAPAAQLFANVGHCPQRHAALLCMPQAACAPCLTGCSWRKLLAITNRRDRTISKERHLLKCELHSFPTLSVPDGISCLNTSGLDFKFMTFSEFFLWDFFWKRLIRCVLVWNVIVDDRTVIFFGNLKKIRFQYLKKNYWKIYCQQDSICSSLCRWSPRPASLPCNFACCHFNCIFMVYVLVIIIIFPFSRKHRTLRENWSSSS